MPVNIIIKNITNKLTLSLSIYYLTRNITDYQIHRSF